MPKEDEKDPEKDPVTEPDNDPPEDLPTGKSKKEDDEGEEDKEPQVSSTVAQKLQRELAEQQKLLKQSQEDLKKFKDGLKSLVGEKEEKKKKDDPNTELKQYMEKQFEQINSRLDEKEHEEVMESLSESMGLKTAEQKEFFEFKIMKAQEEKGEALSQKEIKKIGEGIKKLNSAAEGSKGSSVVETDGGPAVNIGNTDNISYKNFKDMDLMEKAELFRANPKMFDKYTTRHNEEVMKID